MREEGGLQWSDDHNSHFKVNKSAIFHFSKKTTPDFNQEDRQIPLPRPTLMLGNQIVQEVNSYKYLGIQIDHQLRWTEQEQRATVNATKWILQFWRLSRPSTGVNNKLMWQLYLSIALLKITYGIDTWYSPPSKLIGYTKNTGSVRALHNLQKAQRIATLAITGTLSVKLKMIIDYSQSLSAVTNVI